MIPLPLRDYNEPSRRPLVMPALVVLNVLVWFFQLQHDVSTSVLEYGAIPAWVIDGIREGTLLLPAGPTDFVGHHKSMQQIHLIQEVPARWTVLTSMFFHGGWLHLIGNMWFLWIFGDNVEDQMGRVRFLIFYLACGAVAALTQIFMTPNSTVPMVGASGAIAGVLGAYLLLYPKARVRCLWILIIFITTIDLPAWLILGGWFASQFFLPRDSGVAGMAHVGGFVAGLVLVGFFARSKRKPPPAPTYYS